MAQIEVVEFLAKTADPTLLNDGDKYIVTIRYNGNEYKATVPYQPITSLADLKTVLQAVVAKAKVKPRAVNLTDKYKGVYTI